MRSSFTRLVNQNEKFPGSQTKEEIAKDAIEWATPH